MKFDEWWNGMFSGCFRAEFEHTHRAVAESAWKEKEKQLAVAHKTIETLRNQLARKIEAQKRWRKK